MHSPRPDVGDGGTPPRRGKARETTVSPPTLTGRGSPRTGERLVVERYAARLKIALRLTAAPGPEGVGDLPAPHATAVSSHRGTLRARLYCSGVGGQLLGFAFERLELEVRTDGVAAPEEVVRAAADALSQEVLVSLDEHGLVRGLRFPPGLARSSRNTWREILTRWQVGRSREEVGGHWTLTEPDTAGSVLARYTRVDDLSRFTHRKLVERPGPDGGPAQQIGSARLRLVGEEREVEGEDEVSVALLGGRLRVDSVSRHAFARVEVVSEEVGAAELDRLRARLDGQPLLDLRSEPPEGAAGETSRAPGAQALTVAGLETLWVRPEGGVADDPELLREWVRALARDEGLVADVIARLSAGPRPPELDAFLVGALAAAGSPSAQQALLDLVERRETDQELAESALLAVVHVQAPIAAWDGRLAGLADQPGSLGDSALLMLGVVGSRARRDDPERADGIQALLERASDEGPVARRALALQSLGNLEPLAPPASVRRALEDADPLLRRAGAEALRSVQGPEAERLLVLALGADPSGLVRRAAITAYAERGREGGNAPLAEAAATDPEPGVRAAALAALAQASAGPRPPASYFEQVALRDDSGPVRQLAQRLAAAPSPGDAPSGR